MRLNVTSLKTIFRNKVQRRARFSQIFSPRFVVDPSEPSPKPLESLQKTLAEVMEDHPEGPEVPVAVGHRKLENDLQLPIT